MDALLGLLLLVGLACVVAGPVLAVLALVRLNHLQRELSRLITEVALLSHRTRPGTAASVAEPAAPKPPSVPPPEPVMTPEPPPTAVEPPPRPTARPPAAKPETQPLPPTPKIDWERWIGIRGAAALGAVALGLAGLLFFKYSIERGLITPAMRVVLGAVVGLGCVVSSGWLRRRDQRYVAEGVAGAGVVILYAAFWAAHILYALIPLALAFVLMILVTVTCCWIAWRHSAFAVAAIGLVGGFATPLLLSSGADRPIGLFGYVLLLDLGLLALGHRRNWPSLGISSLLGTVLMQGLWIGGRMGPERIFLGLIILGVFAAVFVLGAQLALGGESRRPWLWSQTAAIFFPFAFAVHFAGRVELGPHLYPIAILMALLSAAACWLSRERNRYSPAVGAAAASIGVTGVWLIAHSPGAASSWEAVGVMIALAGLFHMFVELERERTGVAGPVPAALTAAGGAFVLILSAVADASDGFTPWPWLSGLVALSALLYRHAGFPGRAVLQVAAALGFGVGLTWIPAMQHDAPTFPNASVYLALMLVATVAAHAVAMARRAGDARRSADHAAAALPLVMLIGLAAGPLLPRLAAAPALGGSLLLGLLVALAATRLGSGSWYAAAVAATWLPQVAWAWRPEVAESYALAGRALGLTMVAVVALTAWPFFASERFSKERFAWYGAALAGPLWFPTLRHLFVAAFGDDFIGALPLALAMISMAALMRARSVWAPGQAMRLTAQVWFGAVTLCFVSVAVPLQLDREWITIGWALEGLAVLALWKRLDHPGLKYFGLALLGAASVRLVANPALLDYHPRSSVRVFNWLIYTYVVPAAALLGSAAILRPLELERLRRWERELYSKPWPLGAIAVSFAAVMVVFVWINLSIADWFSTGTKLTLSLGSTPPQRLAVSIAWAMYGLILLSIGMARDRLGLRWLSLGFLLVTIVKVFLYDLGNLQDLYRVFSLVGLAVSLLLVSFLYQRFVFRKAGPEAG